MYSKIYKFNEYLFKHRKLFGAQYGPVRIVRSEQTARYYLLCG